MNRICIDCGAQFSGIGVSPIRKRCAPCTETYRAAMSAAHAVVSVARRRGDITPPACACADCGEPAQEWDHRDYRKPLELEAVCRKCNRSRGPALYDKRPSAQC
jgi:hypothetical protein